MRCRTKDGSCFRVTWLRIVCSVCNALIVVLEAVFFIVPNPLFITLESYEEAESKTDNAMYGSDLSSEETVQSNEGLICSESDEDANIVEKTQPGVKKRGRKARQTVQKIQLPPMPAPVVISETPTSRSSPLVEVKTPTLCLANSSTASSQNPSQTPRRQPSEPPISVAGPSTPSVPFSTGDPCHVKNVFGFNMVSLKSFFRYRLAKHGRDGSCKFVICF